MASITTNAGPLDVQSIVSQLMSVEQQPVTQSQTRSTKAQSQLSDLGNISSSLSALQGALSKLTSGSFVQQFKVGSTDSTVASASASSGGRPGSYNLDVAQLAQSRQLVFDQSPSGVSITDAEAKMTGMPQSLSLTVNGKTTEITFPEYTETVTDEQGQPAQVTSMSLKNLVDKVNAAGAGVTASIVQNNGKYKMVLQSTDAGAAKAFSISAGGADSGSAAGSSFAGLTQSDTAASESHDATDAQVSINGVSVSSDSNHLTDAIEGVNIDISKVGSTVITVNQDNESIGKSLQDFVDSYNKVKTTIDSARDSKGSLKGNASVLSIEQKFVSILQTPVPGADPVTSYAYLSQIGISLQKDGTLKLDQGAFNAALNKDPSAVIKLFGNSTTTGFGDRFNAAVNDMLGPDGIIETSKASVNSRLSYETSLQDRMSKQLDQKKTQYLQQYTTLNSNLSQMQKATENLSGLLDGVSSNRK